MLIDTIVYDMHEPAVAALLEVSATLGWHPLAGFDLMVWLSFFCHYFARFHVKNSEASSKSGKHLMRRGPSTVGSIIAVIDAPNF